MDISIISFALILFLVGSALILFFGIREWLKMKNDIEKEMKKIDARIKEKRKEFERTKRKGAR